jgi:hypothetical protein
MIKLEAQVATRCAHLSSQRMIDFWFYLSQEFGLYFKLKTKDELCQELRKGFSQ